MGKIPGRPRESGLADMAIKPPPREYWEPDPAHVVKEPAIHIPVTTSGDVKYTLVMSNEGARLAAFALMLFCVDDQGEHEMARWDCCHGEVHVHYYDRDGRQYRRDVILPITRPEDVSVGYDRAFANMEDYEEIRKGWERGY